MCSLGHKDPIKVSNKCPATIFAANRIDKVPGRITLLIVSIITITGINKEGVPIGTKWVIIWLYWNKIDHTIPPNHKGNANLNVITKWLVLVKI